MFSIHLNIEKACSHVWAPSYLTVASEIKIQSRYTDFHSTKNLLKMSKQHLGSVYEFHRARFRLTISWWNSPNNMPQLILIYTVSL